MSALVTSTDTDITTSRFIMYDENATEVKSLYFSRGTRNSQSFTVSSDIYMVRFYASRNNETSADDTFTFADIQIESGTTATDYEPYVGGTASPNPDYPQEINSVGDKGYFDGELLNGIYNNVTGAFTSLVFYVCSKNPVPCKEGDSINVKYGAVANAISIVYYDIDMNQVNYVAIANVSEIAHTAPANASYFHYSINENGLALTPSTAKKIVVTINGMYALIQKSVNKNLFKVTATTTELNGGKFTVYEDGTVGVSGTFTATTQFILGSFNYLANTKYICTGCPSGGSATSGYKIKFNYGNTWIDTGSGFTVNTTKDTVETPTIVIYSGQTVNLLFKPMIRLAEITDDTYVPHEEQTTYIPIAEPLRGIGEVKDEVKTVDGLWNENRKVGKIVYKASSFIDAYSYANVKYFALPKPTDCKGYGKNMHCTVISDKFIDYRAGTYGHDNVKAVYGINSLAHINYFWFGFPVDTTLEEAQSIGDIEVIYELATETFTPFTDQTPFHQMKTFDGVTLISSDAEMVVEVPTSRAGGVASEGWSKGHLAEIEMQNLSTKIAELQAAIVNL